MTMSSGSASGCLASPILGFEPSSSTIGGGQQLRTQRSLLAELLCGTPVLDCLPSEDNEYGEDDSARCLAAPSTQRTWCSCNVGQNVPGEFHQYQCPCRTSAAGAESCAEVDPQLTSPIAIPTKTYFKCSRQIEERQRIQYQRQVYRYQQEALMQAQQTTDQAV